MFALFTTFLLTAIIGWAATRFMESMARGWGALSMGGFRRENGGGVPLLGGLAVASTFLVSLFIFDFHLAVRWSLMLAPLIAIGVWDDKSERRARIKMCFQFSAVVAWWVLTPKDQMFFTAFGLPEWLTFALSALWIMGLMNATNMVDGVDGLAATVAVTTAGCMAFCFNIPGPIALVAFAGAFTGFIGRNWHPARIYMGEVGSPMIGFVLGVTLMSWHPVNPNWTHIAVPLLFMMYPEIDLWAAIIRRVRDGKSVLSGDRNHIHHQLIRLGLSARGVCITAGSINLIAGLFAITLSKGPEQTSSAWTLLCGLVSLAAFYSWMFVCMRLFTLKTGRIGQSFIEKYFKLEPMPLPGQFTGRVIVLDIHGYYKILQARGVDHISAFVYDLKAMTESCFGTDVNYWFTGLSTILVGIHDNDIPFTMRVQLQKEFTDLLERFDVRLYEDSMPVGMRFLTKEEAETLFTRNYEIASQLERVS
jgi:UDP-GlcNAc:undecaprenyl-phosphate GlcNAc-1-phosphate transferase